MPVGCASSLTNYIRPQDYKQKNICNSAEHKIFPADKCLNTNNRYVSWDPGHTYVYFSCITWFFFLFFLKQMLHNNCCTIIVYVVTEKRGLFNIVIICVQFRCVYAIQYVKSNELCQI